jgi:hypothetical protein
MVTKLLRGTANFTMKTMVTVAAALDCEIAVSLVPVVDSSGTADGEEPRHRPANPAA